MQVTDQSPPAKAVVIAAGRASGELTRLLGFNAPLVAERGYHAMPRPTTYGFHLLVRPAERGFFITPMDEGLRVAGTVELAAPHQPPCTAPTCWCAISRTSSPGSAAPRWPLDRRAPSLPDFRPAIGRAPRLANVYCGYGHQHVGLTRATATGRLIARQIAGEALPQVLDACVWAGRSSNCAREPAGLALLVTCAFVTS